MRGNWRSGLDGGHHRTPVEMRFIDMFMSAVGSLLFLALLFAFVIAKSENKERQNPAPNLPNQKLQILTRLIPSGREGEGYELALAYRGGSGRISWVLTGDIPPGLSFDNDNGVLKGTPTKRGLFSFAITAKDEKGSSDPRPYSMDVAPAIIQAQRFNIWVAGILLAVIAFMTWAAFMGVRSLRRLVAYGEELYRQGHATMAVNRGRFRKENVELPQGLDELRAEIHTTRRIGWALLCVCLAIVAYLVWILWPNA